MASEDLEHITIQKVWSWSDVLMFLKEVSCTPMQLLIKI